MINWTDDQNDEAIQWARKLHRGWPDAVADSNSVQVVADWTNVEFYAVTQSYGDTDLTVLVIRSSEFEAILGWPHKWNQGCLLFSATGRGDHDQALASITRLLFDLPVENTRSLSDKDEIDIDLFCREWGEIRRYEIVND